MEVEVAPARAAPIGERQTLADASETDIRALSKAGSARAPMVQVGRMVAG